MEVEPHKLIRYTIGDGRLVDIRFEDGPGGITVTESFETEDVNSAELQRQGWQAILDNFKSMRKHCHEVRHCSHLQAYVL